MKFSQLRAFDTSNGPGVRVSLFVSGCTLKCKGCFNPESWDFDAGNDFTQETVDEIIRLLNQDYIEGFSLLGGDPLEAQNIDVVTDLCRQVKAACPNKTIWLWTGRKYENFEDHPIMQYLDTVVDGPYIEKFKITEQGHYCGSSNQRVIPIHVEK